MNVGVFVSTFLAASIEVIEMVAIIVAVGVTRQWRGALAGTAAGLLVLAALIAGLGSALQGVPLTPIRLVVGALLLVFGLQWLRKGVLAVSRDGWARGIGEQRVEEDVGDGFDWTGFVLAFRGVSLEGLEIAIIVVAFGGRRRSLVAAHRRPRVRELPPRSADSAASAAAVRRRVAHHVRDVLGGRGPARELARERPLTAVVGRSLRGGRTRVGSRGV
jgi:hypothetical protein